MGNKSRMKKQKVITLREAKARNLAPCYSNNGQTSLKFSRVVSALIGYSPRFAPTLFVEPWKSRVKWSSLLNIYEQSREAIA